MKTLARHLHSVPRAASDVAAHEAPAPIRVRLGQGCFEVVSGDRVLLTAREPEWAAFDGLLFAELQGRALELEEGVPQRAIALARELLSAWRRADATSDDP